MDQNIDANCPNCARERKVPAKYAGKQVRCPTCKESFVIPGKRPVPTVPPLPSNPVAPPVAINDAAADSGNVTSTWYKNLVAVVPGERYPSLKLFLKFQKLLGILFILLALVAPTVFLIIVFGNDPSPGNRAYMAPPSVSLFSAFLAFTAFTALLIAGVFLNISAQTVIVLLDIEENTRRTADAAERD